MNGRQRFLWEQGCGAMVAQLGQSCCPLNIFMALPSWKQIHVLQIMEKIVFNSQQSSIKVVRGKHSMSSRNMGVERGTNKSLLYYIFTASQWIMFSNNCRKAELGISCHYHFPLISMHLFL